MPRRFLFCVRSFGVAPMRGGSHFLCCCKESNQRKQLMRPKGTTVATLDTPLMEQHLSVHLSEHASPALSWPPPRAFFFSGTAPFSSVFALRAPTRDSLSSVRACFSLAFPAFFLSVLIAFLCLTFIFASSYPRAFIPS